LNQKLFDICNQVRESQIGVRKTIDGACKEVTLAIAYKAVKSKIDTCICCGTYNDEEHHWIRHDGKIYDATASQFGVGDEVAVMLEADAKQYSESYFVFVNSHFVEVLLRT